MTERLQRLFRSLWIHKMKSSSVFYVGYYNGHSNPDANVECQYNFQRHGIKSVSDLDLSLNLTTLLECVERASCYANLSVFKCGLSSALAVFKCMSMADGDATAHTNQLIEWTAKITDIGVKEPSTIRTSNEVRIKHALYDRGERSGNNARCNNKTIGNNRNYSSTSRAFQKHVTAHLTELCPKVKDKIPDLSFLWETAKIKDVALIITLNYASLFVTVPHLEFLHRRSFRHIVYCGPETTNFTTYAQEHGLNHVTFVEGLSSGWHFMYQCVTHVMKLDLPVKGYFQIGDDNLINPWMLESLPRDQIWMPNGYSKAKIDEAYKYRDWYHWTSKYGKTAVESAFKELRSVARGSSLSSFPTVTSSLTAAPSVNLQAVAQTFLENYSKNVGLEFVIKRAMDIFYIPQTLKTEYIALSELFRRNNCMIELAIPMMHLGMAARENITYFSGKNLWRKDRKKPWQLYEHSSTFIHPIKLLTHLRTAEGKEFFCGTYLKHYKEWLGK